MAAKQDKLFRTKVFKKDQGRPLKTSRLTKYRESVIFSQKPLTVSLWSVLQAESDGQHGIILKELSRESVPPEIVTLLQNTEMSASVQ